MAENEKLLITIEVDRKTGAAVIAGQDLEKLGLSAQKAQGSIGDLSKTFGTLGSVLSTAAIIAFAKSAIDSANQEDEALRRLKFQVEATGDSWDKNSKSIQAWADAIQASTRFGDTQAYDALEKLTKMTGSFTEGQKLSTLAMDISVGTGKDLNMVIAELGRAYTGDTRSLAIFKREFGEQLKGIDGGIGVINKLSEIYSGAAVAEDNFVKSTKQTSNVFGDLKEDIGRNLMPVLDNLFKQLKDNASSIYPIATGITAVVSTLITGLVTGVKIFVENLTAQFQILATGIGTLIKVINHIIKGEFSEAFSSVKEGLKNAKDTGSQAIDSIVKHSKEGGDSLDKIWSTASDKIIEQSKKTADTEKKNALDTSQFKIEKKEQELVKTLEQIEKEKQEELKKQQLSYDLNQTSLKDYISFLDQRINAIQGSSLKELELKKQLTDTKRKVEEDYNSAMVESTEELAELHDKRIETEEKTTELIATLGESELKNKLYNISKEGEERKKWIIENVQDETTRNKLLEKNTKDTRKKNVDAVIEQYDLMEIAGKGYDIVAKALEEGDADRRKVLILRALEDEMAAYAKKLTMAALYNLAIGNYAQAGLAAAGAAALLITKNQLATERKQTEDSIKLKDEARAAQVKADQAKLLATEKNADEQEEITENRLKYEAQLSEDGRKKYVAHLKDKQKAHKEYTNDWLSLQNEIERTESQQLDRTIQNRKDAALQIGGTSVRSEQQQVSNTYHIHIDAHPLDIRTISEAWFNEFARAIIPYIEREKKR